MASPTIKSKSLSLSMSKSVGVHNIQHQKHYLIDPLMVI